MNIFAGNKTLNFFGKEDEELSPGESTSKRMRRTWFWFLSAVYF
jgi:hypothetical protein